MYTSYFINVTTSQFKMTDAACIISVLDSSGLKSCQKRWMNLKFILETKLILSESNFMNQISEFAGNEHGIEEIGQMNLAGRFLFWAIVWM